MNTNEVSATKMEVYRIHFLSPEGVNLNLPVQDMQTAEEVAKFTQNFIYRSWSLWEVVLKNGSKIKVESIEAAKWYRDDVEDSYGWSWHDIYIDGNGKEIYNQIKGDYTLTTPDAVGRDTGVLVALDRVPK